MNEKIQNFFKSDKGKIIPVLNTIFVVISVLIVALTAIMPVLTVNERTFKGYEVIFYSYAEQGIATYGRNCFTFNPLLIAGVVLTTKYLLSGKKQSKKA